MTTTAQIYGKESREKACKNKEAQNELYGVTIINFEFSRLDLALRRWTEMRAVMKSISPQIWDNLVEKRCSILISKTAPKCDVPFNGYLYCAKTKNKHKRSFYEGAYDDSEGHVVYAQQRVVGEFVCNKIERIEPIFDFYYSYSGYDDSSDSSYFKGYFIDAETLDKIGLTKQELCDYGDGEVLYAWYISDLKIYDRPKKLSEFKTPPCEKGEKACANCKWLVKVNTPDKYECECYVEDGRPITRAPKSWQYVEEL